MTTPPGSGLDGFLRLGLLLPGSRPHTRGPVYLGRTLAHETLREQSGFPHRAGGPCRGGRLTPGSPPAPWRTAQARAAGLLRAWPRAVQSAPRAPQAASPGVEAPSPPALTSCCPSGLFQQDPVGTRFQANLGGWWTGRREDGGQAPSPALPQSRPLFRFYRWKLRPTRHLEELMGQDRVWRPSRAVLCSALSCRLSEEQRTPV